MQEAVDLLTGFLQELTTYTQTREATELWYKEDQEKLAEDQQQRLAGIEAEHQGNQTRCDGMEKRVEQEKDRKQTKALDEISRMQDALRCRITTNQELCDSILAFRSKITRPEFYKYEEAYAEYGDFFPEITSLVQFQSLNLEAMVEVINSKKRDGWFNRLRMKLGDENVLMEFAAFNNLLNKARIFCNMENEELEKIAHQDIREQEDNLDAVLEDYEDKLQEIQKNREKYEHNYQIQISEHEKQCEEEDQELEEQLEERRKQEKEAFEQVMSEDYSSDRIRELYEEMRSAGDQLEEEVCEDDVPLRAKLGLLWFAITEALLEPVIKDFVEEHYEYMLNGDKLVLPGISR